jgi:hypothetical protein
MSVAGPVHPGMTQLKWAIERQIVRRAGRRIRQLRVEVGADRVVVHGRTVCYHVKQLAIRAVLEVLGEVGHALDAEVRVQVDPPNQLSGD